MPISVPRILSIVDWNRRDIEGVEVYFSRVIAAITRWLYYYLEREGRARLARYLRTLTTAGRVGWLRRYYPFLPERSRFYAEALVRIYDLRGEIRELETGLAYVRDRRELLRRAVELKRRERDFLQDLIASLREYIPERPRWREVVEEVLRRVDDRIDALLSMVGSLEGFVLEARTDKPIANAEVEVVGVERVRTDDRGYYRIDWIPTGRHKVRVSATGYTAVEAEIEIKPREVVRRDWHLEPVPPPVRIYKVLGTRMFYRVERKKYTPSPFCFMAIKVFTRDPERYSESFMRSALDFLSSEQAFYTLAYIPSKPRLGFSAYYVDGYESRPADPDEIEEPLDRMWFSVTFYRVKGNVVYVYREYYGWIEFVGGVWHLHLEGSSRYPSRPRWDEAPDPSEVMP